MIIISNRKLIIPQGERHIGFTGDNLVETRVFAITDKSLFNMEFRIDLEKTKETVIAEKKLSDDGETLYLTWNITSAVLKNMPAAEFQIRGFETDGEKVWHSEKGCFFVSSSVDVESEITPEQLSEFQILEQNAASYCNNAQAQASLAAEHCAKAEKYANQSKTDYTQLAQSVYTKTETDDKLLLKAEKEHEHAVVSKVETPILLSKDNTTIIEGEEIAADIYEKSLFTSGQSSFEIKVSGKIKLKLMVSDDGSATIHFDGNLVGDIGGINYGYGTNEFEYDGEIKEKITIRLSIGTLDFQSFTQIDTTEKGFMSIDHLDRLETLEANQGDIDTALDSILQIQNSLMGGESV